MEVIELDSSDSDIDEEVIDEEDIDDEDIDEDLDLNCTGELVSGKKKVEDWLMNCDGENANKHGDCYETVFQQKTVVVNEIIDEEESMGSVDTEQYIKSNRRKTATKITTTTIKKYYSIIGVCSDATANNEENKSDDRVLLPMIEDVTTNEEKKEPCKLPNTSKGKILKTNRKVRGQQVPQDGDTSHDDERISLVQVPTSIAGANKRKRTTIPRKYRLSNNVQKSTSAGKSIPLNARKKPKRLKKVIKRKSRFPRVTRFKRKSLNDVTDPVSETSKAETDGSTTKDSASNSKSKATVTKTSDVYLKRPYNYSSDSEQEDILLSSYKPFSLMK